MLTLILAGLLGCTPAAGPAPADELAWLVGDWTRAQEGELTTTERWMPLADGSLLGSGYVGDRVLVYAEALAIVEGPGGRRLHAWPNGQAIVAYKQVSLGDGEVVFAAEVDAFPQTITYRRSGEGIEVVASGQRGGAAHEERWVLQRAR